MDMMTGGDLEYYLVRKGRFAERLARFYMAEVLLGVKYLHDRGIMHRDLKVQQHANEQSAQACGLITLCILFTNSPPMCCWAPMVMWQSPT